MTKQAKHELLKVAVSAIAVGYCLSWLLRAFCLAEPFPSGGSVACLVVVLAGAFFVARSIGNATRLPADLDVARDALKKSYWCYVVYSAMIGFSGYIEYWYCVVGEQRRAFLLEMGYSKAALAMPHCIILFFLLTALILTLVMARRLGSGKKWIAGTPEMGQNGGSQRL